MKYGVVLPIWQLTVAEAESLATQAEALGLDGVFVPDHILAKPATTQHYGGHWPDPFSLLAFLAGRTPRISWAPASSCCPTATRSSRPRPRPPWTRPRAAASSSASAWAGTRPSSWTCACRSAERGRLSDDYIRAIKAAFAADIPQYSGKYTSFSGRHLLPAAGAAPASADLGGRLAGRGLGRPRCGAAPSWATPGTRSASGLDEIEKGYATLRDLASRAGRRDALGLAPRNLLDLADGAKGAGRAAFQGSVAEVAADVKRVQGMGADWMTFDLPRAGIPAMTRAMERLVSEVKPAAA